MKKGVYPGRSVGIDIVEIGIGRLLSRSLQTWHARLWLNLSPCSITVYVGILTINLLVEEITRKDWKSNVTHSDLRTETIEMWQQRPFIDNGTGSWTKQLIPDLRLHTNIGNYITYALSDHGKFGHYLHRFK